MTNVEAALAMIQDGFLVGLGSGNASWKFIEALGERVRGGLKVEGIPASVASANLAVKVGIPLVDLTSDRMIDITVDGADEVDPQLNLIKGYGHALVREKIIAVAAKRFIILVGPERIEEKIVQNLGQRGKLPVEVVPFALGYCQRELSRLGLPGELLKDGEKTFVSDNGNYILECRVSKIVDATDLERKICDIPGVVDTGFFLRMAEKVLIQWPDRLEVRERK